jgi:hypothetical protein
MEGYMLRLRRAARMPAWAVDDRLAAGIAKLSRKFTSEDGLQKRG